jgi:hypothetical protein
MTTEKLLWGQPSNINRSMPSPSSSREEPANVGTNEAGMILEAAFRIFSDLL